MYAPISTFSQTDISGKRLRSWGTWTIPSSSRLRGLRPAIGAVAERDRAPARPQQAADGAQHRRLARAVRADQAGDPLGLDLEVEAAQHVAVAVAGDDALEDDALVISSPRYASSTAGSLCTCAGVPSAIFGAAVEHDHRVAEAHDDVHVVLDDQERQPLRVEPADVALDVLDQDRVDARGRLVEQDELRPAHQRRRELEQLPLAVRELSAAQVGMREQPELVEQLVRACPLGGLDRGAADGSTRVLDGEREVLDERQLREDPRLLEGADESVAARADRGAGRRTALPAEADRPGVRLQVAGDEVEDGRLARSRSARSGR